MGKNFITLSQFDSLAAVSSAAIKKVSDSISSDTQVVTVSGGGGGLAFSYGDTQPVIPSLWLDTSKFASIQGATPTQTISFENSEVPLIVSDTKPDKKNIFWLDTSKNYREE